jgi:endonuclease-3
VPVFLDFARVRMVATADAKRHAAKIVRRLKAAYPVARCALNFKTPLELLVATILSAQCTDARVNLVTRELFEKYRTAADFARAKTPELERAIQSAGFFRMKAKSIQGASRKLVDEYGGRVPQDLDSLVELPGVGRKTANVVLGTAFGIASGVVVDTHVTRVTRRLGMTRATDAVKIEQDLVAQIPKREWIDFSHRVILHGRQICVARKPRCPICPINDLCPKIGVADGALLD